MWAALQNTAGWAAYQQQRCTAHRSRGCESQIRVPALSGEGPLQVTDFCFILMWEKGLATSLESLSYGINPIYEGTASEAETIFPS